MHLLIAFVLTIPMAAIACGFQIGFIHYYVLKEPHKCQEIINVQEKNCLGGFIILGVLVVYRLIKGQDVLIMFAMVMILLGMYLGVALCKHNDWFGN